MADTGTKGQARTGKEETLKLELFKTRDILPTPIFHLHFTFFFFFQTPTPSQLGFNCIEYGYGNFYKTCC